MKVIDTREYVSVLKQLTDDGREVSMRIAGNSMAPFLILAVVTKVIRKGKTIQPGDFWWEFFRHVWLHMIPLRRPVMALYTKLLFRGGRS